MEDSFWRNLLGGIMWEKFYVRNFWEVYFGRNSFFALVCQNKERRRRKDKKFRSSEVRRKLIALKNGEMSEKKYLGYAVI